MKRVLLFALALVAAVGIAPRPAPAQLPIRLVMAVDDVVDPVIRPAHEVEYAVEVANFSNAPIEGVTITAETPEGTYFGEASTNVGTIAAPAQGGRGEMVVTVGTLASGASARVRFELGLDAGAGSQLFFSATVASAADAPEQIAETTFLAERGDPILRWGSVFPFGPDPRLSPTAVRVERPVEPFFRHVLFPLGPAIEGIEYRVYRDQTPDVALIEANLVATLPATQLNTGTLTEPGFYVVTAVRDGVESAPSNVVSMGMGEPVIERVTIKGAVLKAQGSAIDEAVEVTVDGIEFANRPSVKRGGTRIVQAGRLATGETVTKYLKVRPSALISFKNPNGSVSSWLYTSVRFEQ